MKPWCNIEDVSNLMMIIQAIVLDEKVIQNRLCDLFYQSE